MADLTRAELRALYWAASFVLDRIDDPVVQRAMKQGFRNALWKLPLRKARAELSREMAVPLLDEQEQLRRALLKEIDETAQVIYRELENGGADLSTVDTPAVVARILREFMDPGR